MFMLQTLKKLHFKVFAKFFAKNLNQISQHFLTHCKVALPILKDTRKNGQPSKSQLAKKSDCQKKSIR
jgi:hypothetical protein